MTEPCDSRSEPSPLAALLAHIARHKPVADAVSQAGPVDTGLAGSRSGDRGLLDDPAHQAYFRALWTDVNARRQLGQSQAHVPDNAGPLNSNHLVHRCLTLMQESAPGYLRHFLAHVEAMSWMAQLDAGQESVSQGERTPKPRKGRTTR